VITSVLSKIITPHTHSKYLLKVTSIHNILGRTVIGIDVKLMQCTLTIKGCMCSSVW